MLFSTAMAKRFLYTIFLGGLLFLHTSYLSHKPKRLIVIDPGHGGYDFGAVGYGNSIEKDIVLQISKEIVRLNNELLKDKYDIYLTRYKDTFVSLRKRSLLAQKLKASLFVSVHCNRLPGHSHTKGMEVYVAKPLENYSQQNSKASISLGLLLTREFSEKLSIKTKGVQFASFQVLRESVKNQPSVLIETAYVSNKIEAAYFKEHKNITAIALAILNSIDKYFKTAK